MRQQLQELERRLAHYQSLFTNMTEGFALGEALRNAAGVVHDFRFLEVNEAFYRQTGLPRGIVGRPSLEWAPRQERVWRERFCSVAQSGESQWFEDFNVDTGRYYEMYCYAPSPGHFAILFRDISDRRQAEDELRHEQRSLLEAERRYSALFNNKVNGMMHGRVITDSRGKSVDFEYLEVNPAFERIIGRSRDEIVGQRVTRAFPGIKDLEPDLIGLYGELALHGGERRFELDFPITGHWFDVYAYSHEVGEFTVIFADITERKRAEVALRASEAVMRASFDEAGVGIAHVSVDGRYLRVNQKFCEMTGYSAAELESMDVAALTYPDDRDVGIAELRRALARESGSFSVEKRYVCKSGRIIWVRINAAPVHTPAGGEPPYCIGIVEDITTRKQAQAELEGFFLQAAVGVFTVDLDGRIGRVNRNICQLLGYSEAELQAMTFDMLCHPDDLALNLDLFARLRVGAIPGYTLEKRFRCKNGEYTWAISSVALGSTEAGIQPHAVDVVTDITMSKRLEQELMETRLELEVRVERRTQELRLATWQAEQALAEAEAANRAKTDFLATMSHEIRTPLNGVIGFNGLLLSSALTDEQRRYAELARQSGEALLHLLNDFLDFTKIESGRLELEPVEFDLVQEIGHLLALVQKTAQEKGLELRTEIGVSGRLRGDVARLRQILLNLLYNAVKFTLAGSVTLCCEEARREGALVHICFRVVDTGIGIDPGVCRRLFQPFMQADASTTRRFGGTGLGLAISKRLAEAMGGHIGVRSAPGQGSTFWLELPFELLASRALPPADASLDALVPAVDGARHGRVLVAEDNTVSQLLVAEIFKRLGYEVDVVGNGREAVEAFRSRPYDLVCMDCDMPVLNGFDATRQIRELESGVQHVPIIAMTASALQGDAEKCIAAGMDDFMSKPLRLGMLSQMVKRWLGQE
jgi:PAS domain S-box-containing protein